MISVGVVAGSGQGTFPSAVSASAVQTSFNSITLSWTAPFNGGAPITSYSYQVSTDNSTWGTAVNAGLVTSVVVGSLSPGTTYYFRVLATNSIGSGPYGASCNAATAKANSAIGRSNIFTYGYVGNGSTGVQYRGFYGDGGGYYQVGSPYTLQCDTLTSPSTGAALAGKTIYFEHTRDGLPWAVVGSATTNGSGLATSAELGSFDLRIGSNIGPDYFRCRFDGDSQYNGVTQSANICYFDFQWGD